VVLQEGVRPRAGHAETTEAMRLVYSIIGPTGPVAGTWQSARCRPHLSDGLQRPFRDHRPAHHSGHGQDVLLDLWSEGKWTHDPGDSGASVGTSRTTAVAWRT
jgi:hypothetical protein